MAKLKNGDIFTTNNCGDLEVIDYLGANDILVRFINTGYTRKSTASAIRRGQVADPYKRTVHGVGYMGDGAYKSSNQGVRTKQYTTWKAMMDRCYSENVHSRFPTYIECSVCEEWHNFQVYAAWFDKSYVEGAELDKDSVVPGNKVYSPSTCIFISKERNLSTGAGVRTLSHKEHGTHEIPNVSRFARENDLCRDSLYRVLSGRLVAYKGWALP